MSPTYIQYPLADGYLHDWLIAGPVLTPLTDLAPAAPLAQTFERFHRPESGVTEPPVDNGPVGEAWMHSSQRMHSSMFSWTMATLPPSFA